MLDETLVVAQSEVRREVSHPSRLPDPIVTGYEDGCFQPYVTVVRDRQTRRFRMWYGVPASPGNADQSRLACIESDDGIHWIRPHRVRDPAHPVRCERARRRPGLRRARKRYKYAWWKNGGLQVGGIPDGLSGRRSPRASCLAEQS